MIKIAEVIKSGRILVSDGAWGTLLHTMGLKVGECPESWCLSRATDIRAVAKAYADAGADMVGTNSFGANRFKLAHYGLSGKAAEINEASARASRAGASPERWVLGSMGSTGKLLLYDDVTEEEIYDAYKEQAAALERGGADAVCIETMTDMQEAALAVKAAKENTGLEVICTFTFDRTARGAYRTMMGVSPARAAVEMLAAGADVVGANCGCGMEQMVEIVQQMRAAAPDAPILVHANAGLPETVDGIAVFPETPSDMAAMVPALIQAGANIIGGCCGTTPAHIRAVKEAVRGM
ncbi:MAG: homocysteine S-methyltransferase family protein [Firmicutes bacterium]|nr:homocysteine S-methyltransferase family protein [Bacillota bacterium]